MAAVLLQRRVTPKIWGVTEVPASFGTMGRIEEPVGEIWFEDPCERDLELLLKYIFTSEKLSIQAHPGDAAAWNRGLPRGKDEAWLILAAEPGGDNSPRTAREAA